MEFGHCKKEGIVELSCSHNKENVYFTITDNGIGMDNITIENMMKPYFTTKKIGWLWYWHNDYAKSSRTSSW